MGALALAAALVFAPAGRYIPSPQAAGTGQTGGTWETAETAESGAGERDPAPQPAQAPVPPLRVQAAPLADEILTDAVSPVGTTINLFDYWITSQYAPDDTDPPDMDQGINQGHLLRFSRVSQNQPNIINRYTGSAQPRPGIVRDLLQNGYPVLSEDGESLSYLFDPNQPSAGKAS